MKKLIPALLGAACAAAMLAFPVSAMEPGEIAGYVSYSDIVVTIDGHPIRSYNMDGDSYIVAEDLVEHGFTVVWDDTGYGTLVVRATNEYKGEVTSTYNPADAPTSGTIPYYHSHILTYIDNTPVLSLNIGGETLIRMDDFARFWKDDVWYSDEIGAWVWDAYLWDSDTNTLNLRTRDLGVDSERWSREWRVSHGFTSSDTDHDWYTALDFSFSDDNGLYMYAHSHGDATLVDSVYLQNDRLTITFADNLYDSAAAIRDAILPDALTGTVTGSALWRQYRPTPYVGVDGFGIYAEDYRSYLMRLPENAWILHDLNAEAAEHVHITINGEESFGIFYRVGDNRLVYLFGHEYAEYGIDSLRVELNRGVG